MTTGTLTPTQKLWNELTRKREEAREKAASLAWTNTWFDGFDVGLAAALDLIAQFDPEAVDPPSESGRVY